MENSEPNKNIKSVEVVSISKHGEKAKFVGDIFLPELSEVSVRYDLDKICKAEAEKAKLTANSTSIKCVISQDVFSSVEEGTQALSGLVSGQAETIKEDTLNLQASWPISTEISSKISEKQQGVGNKMEFKTDVDTEVQETTIIKEMSQVMHIFFIYYIFI